MMRKSVLWNLPHVRLSFALLIALMGSVAISGCGGGGGSSTPKPTPTTPATSDPTKATVTGIITDTTNSGAPVVGASVALAGTTLSTKTGADGKFTILNAPVGPVGVIVASPDLNVYYGAVFYNSKVYNDPAKCPIPLTTQASSKGTSPVGTIQLFPSGSNPPYPPYAGPVDANGCPK